jgi:siderophore synthetase component
MYVSIPQDDDLKRDQLLLKFTQRIWEIPEDKQAEKLAVYHSSLYEKGKNDIGLHIHDILYQDHFQEITALEHTVSCMPTLSFRTLIYDDHHHIKFGLPIFYGNVVRRHVKNEALISLYLSDYIQSLPKIDKLDFFVEYKGYSIHGLEDYSVSYRKKTSSEDTMPMGCYFNQLLNHSAGSPPERLERALAFLATFFQDVNDIYKDLAAYGLGLEFHGQNLLVKLDEKGAFLGKYLYRDFGTCTLEYEQVQTQKDLNHYYKSAYNYEFNPVQMANAGSYRWMNYRVFFLSFLLYNLNQFTEQEGINFNVYAWFEKVTNDLPEIKTIY